MFKYSLFPLLLVSSLAHAQTHQEYLKYLQGNVTPPPAVVHQVNQSQEKYKSPSIEKNEVLALVEKQTEAYNKLADQQSKMLDEMKLLREENKKLMKDVLHMQMISFSYEKALKEAEFKRDEDSFSYLGFKRESVPQWYERLGIKGMIEGYNEMVKKETQNDQKK